MKPDVWATLLALVWLHGFKIDAQVEWQFLAMKAVAWIRSQKGKLYIYYKDAYIQLYIHSVNELWN